MPSDDSNNVINIFSNLSALTNEFDIDWSEDKFGPWVGHFNVLSWPVSVQAESNATIYDYYLVQILGEVSFLSTASWGLDSHCIELIPQGNLATIELVETSPSTTVGYSSYTTGISTTVGGSIGFFGDTPTGSISSSVSFNNSTTKSISDVQIENVSMSDMSPPINSSWRFIIAADSLTAESNCAINVESLYRTPHGTNLTLDVCFTTFLQGGDYDEINALIAPNGYAKNLSNKTDSVNIITSYNNETDSYYSNKASVGLYKTVTFDSPPAPLQTT